MNQQPPQTDSIGQWLSQASYGLLLKLGLLLLAIAAAVFFLAWLIFGDGIAFGPSLEHGLPVSAANAVNPLAQPGLVDIEVNGLPLSVAPRLDPPRLLEIDGFQLTVVPQPLGETQFWGGAELAANQVGWLENSIVNYIFHLPTGRAYRDMLAAASQSGETIKLTTVQDRQFQFVVSRGAEQPTAVSQQQIHQNSPAVTLVWLDGDDSYILTGDYLPTLEDLATTGLDQSFTLTSQETWDNVAYLSVRLDSADIQADGMQLLVRGAIVNSSLEEGVIGQPEITLTGDGLISQILSVNPPLPWRVPPGNSQIAFAITFQRPPDAEYVLTIGPQAFALTFNNAAE